MLRHLQPVTDPNLLVGTETHDDAGVYRLTDSIALVQTVDFFPPVVEDPFTFGQIAAANALSDVYAMGGVPKTALNIAGYPDKELDLDWLGQIIAGAGERCRVAGVTVVGGHTVRDAEVKFGLAVTGVVHPDRIVTNATARPGDVLVLTKPLGTGFVTTARKKGHCPDDVYAAACASMVTLNAAACAAMLEVGANAATDVTGFGLAGHAYEMATGSRVTLRIDLDLLPLLPGAEVLAVPQFHTRASKSNRDYVSADSDIAVANHPRIEFCFDAQTSGGLLVSCPRSRAEELVRRANDNGATTARIIGSVLDRREKALEFITTSR